MISLDEYPDGPIVTTSLDDMEWPNPHVIVGSAFVTIEPVLDDFHWNLRNQVRDWRWEAMIHLVGARFTLELSDLETAITNFRAYLSHGGTLATQRRTDIPG
jgi:hypothetical protein